MSEDLDSDLLLDGHQAFPAEAKPRSFAPAELIDVREVPEGVEYVVLNRSCRLTAFLDRRKSRLRAKVGDQISMPPREILVPDRRSGKGSQATVRPSRTDAAASATRAMTTSFRNRRISSADVYYGTCSLFFSACSP